MSLTSPLFYNEIPRHWVRGSDVSKHRSGLIFMNQISVNGYFDFWLLETYIVSQSGAPVTQRSDSTSQENLLTYSMEQSPSWEANRSSASQEISTYYGTRRFITSFTSARHLSLSWDRSIPSMSPNPTSWGSVLILSSHIRLGLPSGLFLLGFPTKTFYTPLLSPVSATGPAHLIILGLITRTVLSEEHRSSSQENGDLKVTSCSILSVNWRTFALCKQDKSTVVCFSRAGTELWNYYIKHPWNDYIYKTQIPTGASPLCLQNETHTLISRYTPKRQ